MSTDQGAVPAAWIASRRREGFGEGEAGGYKPWLTVRSFGSRGVVHRALGRHGRTYHLLSTLEHRCFLLLEWSPVVEDVREQFPLHDVEETIEIAAGLGVRHPLQSRRIKGRLERRLEPMTTDFLVSIADDRSLPPRVALSVKPAGSFDEPPERVDRLLEKAEIERRYWARRGVPYRIITEREMPDVLVRNLELVLPARDLDGYPFTLDEVPGLLAHLRDCVETAVSVPLGATCAAAERALGLKRGSGLALAWHAIATRQWHVDLHARLGADQPLSFTPHGRARDVPAGEGGWAA